MHYGPGPGNKKPLVIGGAIIGAIWLLNSTYRDGFIDGLVVSGKGEYMHHMGGGFPWGLLILGGILYFFWKKGSFDRFNGRGPVGPGGWGPPATMHQAGQASQEGPDPRAFMSPEQRVQWDQQQAQWAQRYGQGQQFRGPRGVFDDWHRQAHEGFNPQAGTMTPPPPFSGPSTPPPPPAADYWTNVNRPAEANAEPQGPSGSAGASGSTAGASGATGSQPEQW